MKSLITPVGALYLIAGFINGMVALGLLVYALFPAIIGAVAVNGAMNEEEGAMEALVVMAISTVGFGGLGLAFGLLAIAYLIDGYGIVRRRGWARLFGVALALPMLGTCFPIGTVAAVLAIVTLIHGDTEKEFAGFQG